MEQVIAQSYTTQAGEMQAGILLNVSFHASHNIPRSKTQILVYRGALEDAIYAIVPRSHIYYRSSTATQDICADYRKVEIVKGIAE
jgi:hypothetical protein